MHRKSLTRFLYAAVVCAAIAQGCSDDDQAAPPVPDAGNPNRTPDSGGGGGGDATSDAPAEGAGVTYKARATIAKTSLTDAGNVTGTIDLDETNGMVKVAVTISGATPGSHAVHIHDGTSCDDTDAGAAMAAGPHWNPTDAGHGFPDAATHHVGDFGNMTVDGTGAGTLSLDVTGFNVQPGGGNLSAIGHAVIFHQGSDDGTGTNGNAGGRAGCGLVQTRP